MRKQNESFADIGDPMRFFKKLQVITSKIYATNKIEEIMLDLSPDICDLFACDRLTLYVVGEGKTHIESKVKTGLRSFKDFSLPISEQSIAGYVALTKKTLNIADVYDDLALQAISPGLKFMREVDMRTGYRTKQMLVGPLLHDDGAQLLGVVQLINSRCGAAFSAMMEDGLKDLCETLSQVFAQRLSERLVVRSKYDTLIMSGLMSAQEMELAKLVARRKQVDLQIVLTDEFHMKLSDIGTGLAQFFGVEYTPYRADRLRPAQAPDHSKWAYAEHKRWLLLEESAYGITILTTDPDRVKGARVVNHLFPQAQLQFQVTTNLEFKQTAEQFFGVAEMSQVSAAEPITDVEHALHQRIVQTITDAFSKNAADIQIELREEKGRMVRRFDKDGKLASIRGQLRIDYLMDCPGTLP